jgi:hypothetical protein
MAQPGCLISTLLQGIAQATRVTEPASVLQGETKTN